MTGARPDASHRAMKATADDPKKIYNILSKGMTRGS